MSNFNGLLPNAHSKLWDLTLGMRLFLNRSWYTISPDSDVISPYKLIILYSLYIRVGSLADTSIENSVGLFAEAVREVLAFLDWYPYEEFLFQEIEPIVELISHVPPVFLLNLTKSEAITRSLNLPRLDFYQYLECFIQEAEEEVETEPDSSWYEPESKQEEEEKENMCGSLSSEGTSPLRLIPRDILKDITMDTLSQETEKCYVDGKSSPTLLGSPIHFDDKLRSRTEEEDLDDLVYKLKTLFA